MFYHSGIPCSDDSLARYIGSSIEKLLSEWFAWNDEHAVHTIKAVYRNKIDQNWVLDRILIVYGLLANSDRDYIKFI